MRILAFNSSPRDNQTSKTELVLQSFLEGARRAGAETETLYLRNYKIKHCLGCFSCWTKTPGRCVQKDDMAEELFERYLAADLAVLATPLYHYNMNARMKLFIERTLPMVMPGVSKEGQPARPQYRYEKVPKVAVISVCGFPAMDTFRCLSLNMQMILGDLLVAEIYRHTSEALPAPPLAAKVQEVLAAVSRAGEELVRDGRVKPETLAAATQDLAPPEFIMQMSQEHWRQMMEQG
jgi:multimeric flavodoxin WrbA